MFKSMKSKVKASYYRSGAFMTLGLMGVGMNQASAAPGGGGAATDANFSELARNVTESVAGVPGMISGISYLVGSLLGVLGVMKIKDHVENPGNTPLKEGAIRLTAGGALFALPIIFESMLGSVSPEEADGAAQQNLQAVRFGVDGYGAGP